MATRQFHLKLYHFAPKLWSLLTKPLDSVMNMCTFAWTKKNILHGQSKILLNSASIFCVFSLLMFKNEQNFKKWINLEHSPKLALPSPSMEGWGEEQFLYVQWISKLIYKINNSELMNASQVNVSWPGRDSTRSSAKLSLAYKQLAARKRGILSSSWPPTPCQLQEAFQWRHNYLHVPKTAMGQKQRTRKWPKYTQIVKDQGCESKSLAPQWIISSKYYISSEYYNTPLSIIT